MYLDVRASTTNPTSIDDPALPRRHEVLGIIAAAATLLLGFAPWSYDLRGGDNWVGPVGEAEPNGRLSRLDHNSPIIDDICSHFRSAAPAIDCGNATRRLTAAGVVAGDRSGAR